MATITQTKDPAISGPAVQIDIGAWIRETFFGSIAKIILTIVLVGANILAIRGGLLADPVSLSFNLAPNGVPNALGNFVLAVTNGPAMTIFIVAAWLIGAAIVIRGALTNHWPGYAQWLKDSLYNGAFSSLITLFLTIATIFLIRVILSWALFGAEFRSSAELVNTFRDNNLIPGAIWGIVGANAKLFAVGRYPVDEVWRIWTSLGIVLGLGGLSTFAWGFGSPLKQFQRYITWAWLISPIVIIFWLLPGGYGILNPVQTNAWGGFLVTAVLSVAGIVLSFPIGVLLALGRRSEVKGVPYFWAVTTATLLIYWLVMGFPSQPVEFNVPLIFRDPPLWTFTLPPLAYAVFMLAIVGGIGWVISYFLQGNLIKTFCIVYIEVIRGVPLITVLFMAQIMLPIFLPRGLEIDNLLRVAVGIIMFTAAYVAENVRGGLQAIPKGQYEAAAAVGLSGAQSMRLVILPQALRAVIPALVGMFIALFKDTSLVAIVGIFDLLKIAQVVVAQPDWLGLQRETFAFVALVYWVFSFAMSRASQAYERKLGVGEY